MYKFKSQIDKWHIAGFFWIVTIGSLLHFTYEWSGNSNIVGIFSPINESVWEHLKLGYFSLTFFILLEYWFLKDKTQNYALAKIVGIIDMSIFILIIHYSYKFVFKDSNVIVDIGSFIVGAFICQFLSSRIMKKNRPKNINRLGFFIYIFIGILFIIFTFYPPDLPIFEETTIANYVSLIDHLIIQMLTY